MTVWQNWARTQRFKPLAIQRPGSESELIEIVQRAAGAGEKIKAAGAGHSPADIAGSNGARLIELDSLNGIIDVDARARSARVRAGTRLHELNELLAREDLALANLGSISEQSIAGAIATATHGTGREQPGLSDQVNGLRLIGATGEAIDVQANETHTSEREAGGPPPLDAARVHLGALGIVSQVELKVVPAFRLHAREETRELDETLDGLEDWLRMPYFRFWWFPWTSKARVWTASHTDRPADVPAGAFGSFLNDSLRGNRLPETLYALAGARPEPVKAVNRLLRGLLFSGSAERTDRSDRIFNFLIQVRQYVMEYAIPIEHTRAALRGLRRLIEKGNFAAHLPVEVRFTPPGKGWLDMSHGRATCYIGVIMYRPFGGDIAYEKYFRAVDDFFREFEGRPHWAKAYWRDANELRELYPRLGDFAALRERLDPHGMFMNDYLRRVFG